MTTTKRTRHQPPIDQTEQMDQSALDRLEEDPLVGYELVDGQIVPTTKSLVDFDRALRTKVSADARPFLCEGNPFDCRVFLVGLNPKTHTDFWQFWDTTYGCSKSRWLEAYVEKEKKLSRTRTHIEHLLKAMAPVKCLETNLFDAWSQRLADLPKDQRSTSVFDFLLDQIQPDVVFAHGRPVVSHLEELIGAELRLNELQDVVLKGKPVAIYPRHHLSFQISHEACRSIGVLLKQYVAERHGR